MSDRTDERVTTVEHVLPKCDGHGFKNYCGVCAACEALASLAADAAETNRLRNRLRDAPLGGDGSHWDGCHLVHIDCARAHINQVEAERDAAVAEAKVFEETSDFWEAQTSASNAKWTEAVADRDRLAKALDLIGHGWDGDEFNDPADLVEEYASIALDALAGREGSDDAETSRCGKPSPPDWDMKPHLLPCSLAPGHVGHCYHARPEREGSDDA